MPRGASARREREYEELKERFQQEGRYKGREEEVASRIVNKQRSMYGETREDLEEEREGRNPDRGLPIENYRKLKTPQVEQKAKKLSPKQVNKVEQYEKKHKNRKSVVTALEKTKRGKKAA